MVWVHFQTLLHLQPAFLNFPVYEVVLCLFVDLLYFRRDHGEEKLNLAMIFINRIGVPKLFIAIGVVKQTPEHHSSQNDQICIFLVNHDAVVDLAERQLPVVDLEEGHCAFEIVAKKSFLLYFVHDSLVEEGVPFGKGFELCVLEDVLHATDRKKLQSLNLCDVFDFL